ncbi:hypothetical protein INR49_002712, partial [Caranx melampygus]
MDFLFFSPTCTLNPLKSVFRNPVRCDRGEERSINLKGTNTNYSKSQWTVEECVFTGDSSACTTTPGPGSDSGGLLTLQSCFESNLRRDLLQWLHHFHLTSLWTVSDCASAVMDELPLCPARRYYYTEDEGRDSCVRDLRRRDGARRALDVAPPRRGGESRGEESTTASPPQPFKEPRDGCVKKRKKRKKKKVHSRTSPKLGEGRFQPPVGGRITRWSPVLSDDRWAAATMASSAPPEARKFTRGLNKPGTAAELRQSVSEAVRTSVLM